MAVVAVLFVPTVVISMCDCSRLIAATTEEGNILEYIGDIYNDEAQQCLSIDADRGAKWLTTSEIVSILKY